MSAEKLGGLSNIDPAKVTEITDFDPAMILVAADADEKAERIVEYLASKAGLSIEVVTFTYVPLGNGDEILARSILVPEVQTIAKTSATQVKLPEILEIALKRKVLNLVEYFRKVDALRWSEEVLDRNGGTLRYWVATPDGKSKVIFGMNVGGEKLDSPDGSLDVWFNPDTVAEYSGMSLDATWDQLEEFPVLRKSDTKIYMRVVDPDLAEKLHQLFVRWSSDGSQSVHA
jgi:hypothetical protein